MNLWGPTRRVRPHPKLEGQTETFWGHQRRKMGGKVVSLLKMAIQAVSQALLVVERSGKLCSLPKLIAGTGMKKATESLGY